MSDYSNESVLAVHQLFVRHQSALKAFVLALWPNYTEAEDVMQEVFLVITRKAHEFIPDSNFLSWARTIARYEILAAQRRKYRLQSNEAVLEALEADCPEDLGVDRRLEALKRCIEKLPPKSQEIMRLRYHNNYGPNEIATLLQRSVNSINVALAKARVALRECVNLHMAAFEP